MRRFDLLASPGGRRLLFAALYFSEGAPIGYIWWALPTRLREAGVPIEKVTALSALLTVPWTLKFAWAPLVDALRPRRLGLSAWIIGAQLAMGLSFAPVAAIPVPDGYELLLGLLLLHAFCAATQDVSVDALAVATIPPLERGWMTGWMQLGMLLGRAIFGGVALALERRLGAPAVVLLLVACVWVTTLLVAFGVRHESAPRGARSLADRFRGFRGGLVAVLAQARTWLGFATACIAGAAMEATGAIAGPLLVDRGFTTERIGAFFALPAVACMATGALLGGRLADGRPRAVAVGSAVVALALAVCGLAGAAAVAAGPSAWLVVALAVAYFLFGAFTATSYALYMDLTDPELGGTQFSAYMGAVNLCSVWSAWTVGRLVAGLDYPLALASMAGLSLLALPLLALLRGRRHAHAHAALRSRH